MKHKILSKQTVSQGYFRIDEYELEHELFNGGTSARIKREVFERGHVGAVLPFDPVLQEVVLIEQFRPGAMAAGWEPWLLECVAGVIEENETPEDLIRREAVEECGCKIFEIEHIVTCLSTPGACSETVVLYCGRVDASTAQGIHGLADEGEDIKVSRHSLPAAFSLLDDGKIVNAKTIICLQWLRLNHARLTTAWAP
ncbi:MAG: NUDIX domain-containing protein [Arenicellales bacterium WSBS_2016_MAG_OTU3]